MCRHLNTLHALAHGVLCFIVNRYDLVGPEGVDDSGSRRTACNMRRLTIGCVSAIICGDLVGAAKDLLDAKLHLDAFEQGLEYALLNTLASLLMIQSAASSSTSSSNLSSPSSPLLLPNTSASIFSSWFRLHSPSFRSTRRLSGLQLSRAQQYVNVLSICQHT